MIHLFSNVIRLTIKRKAQTITIRCLGSPQATILYGKVCAIARAPNKNCNSSFCISEVVIQTAIELRYVKKTHLFFRCVAKLGQNFVVFKI